MQTALLPTLDAISSMSSHPGNVERVQREIVEHYLQENSRWYHVVHLLRAGRVRNEVEHLIDERRKLPSPHDEHPLRRSKRDMFDSRVSAISTAIPSAEYLLTSNSHVSRSMRDSLSEAHSVMTVAFGYGLIQMSAVELWGSAELRETAALPTLVFAAGAAIIPPL